MRSYLADKRAQEEYERLAREAAQTTQETITIEETEKQELETEPEKEEYQSPYDFDTLKKENPDTIGWIHIPDTKISYPIVMVSWVVWAASLARRSYSSWALFLQDNCAKSGRRLLKIPEVQRRPVFSTEYLCRFFYCLPYIILSFPRCFP